jgi:hypothetical protein
LAKLSKVAKVLVLPVPVPSSAAIDALALFSATRLVRALAGAPADDAPGDPLAVVAGAAFCAS